jgi:hypothetical protein
MSGRVDPFAMLKEPPAFATKQKAEKPAATDAMERISEENNFPSRQAAKAPSTTRRKRRVYRTGRNQQFNAKATRETIEKFYKMADEKSVTLGELMSLALDALEREGASRQHERQNPA